MDSNPPGSRSLRPLLPAAGHPQPASFSSTDIPSTNKSRKESTAVACDACRKRKSKCNGERPTCSKCRAHSTRCIYETRPSETKTQALKRKYRDLEEQKSVFERIYEFLQLRPEAEAADILDRIRRGADPEAILRHVQSGDILLQLSLQPETRFRYEFPYVPNMPSFIMNSDNQYLQSMIFESTCVPHSPPLRARMAHQFQSPYLKPYHAAEIVDPFLSNAQPSKWTSVSSDDGFMRRLLGVYFLHHFPTYPAFQKDYFFQDMAKGRERFCCSLLLNAILAEACHICHSVLDRAKFWVPRNLGYQFLAEARRLWDLELGKGPRVTTIQAAIILNLISNVDGMDKVGDLYLLHAVDMARDLQLFKGPANLKASTKNSRVKAFTAWALFCWQALQRYYFYRSPLIRDPPEVQMPEPSSDPTWYGEIWVRYPPDQAIYHTHFGMLRKAIGEFRVIMNDISSASFASPSSPGPRQTMSWGQVLDFHSRLQAWYLTLPGPLQAKNVVYPSQLRLHLEYFGCLVALFQTQVNGSKPEELETVTVGEERASPHEVISRAKILQETVVRLFYLRHNFDIYDPIAIEYLMFLGNSAVKSIDDELRRGHISRDDFEALRSTLILCAKGLHDQAQNFFVADLGFRVLRDRMRPEDAALMRRYVTPESSEHEQPLDPRHLHSQWPMPIIKINEDPRTARLDSLIKEIGDVSLSSSKQSKRSSRSSQSSQSSKASQSGTAQFEGTWTAEDLGSTGSGGTTAGSR